MIQIPEKEPQTLGAAKERRRGRIKRGEIVGAASASVTTFVRVDQVKPVEGVAGHEDIAPEQVAMNEMMFVQPADVIGEFGDVAMTFTNQDVQAARVRYGLANETGADKAAGAAFFAIGDRGGSVQTPRAKPREILVLASDFRFAEHRAARDAADDLRRFGDPVFLDEDRPVAQLDPAHFGGAGVGEDLAGIERVDGGDGVEAVGAQVRLPVFCRG